ncbi:MAG: CopD family protein [Burkholderiaceae bacterium]
MGGAFLWVKALHIIFVTCWFAGLFYLPRIFVNLALATDDDAAAGRSATPSAAPSAEYRRLLLMARKLYRFMTPLAILALGFGLVLWLHYGIGRGPGNGWMHAKLAIVLLLVAYHFACGALLRGFEAGSNRRGHRWYRFFNEAPVLALFAAVILVVVKPF